MEQWWNDDLQGKTAETDRNTRSTATSSSTNITFHLSYIFFFPDVVKTQLLTSRAMAQPTRLDEVTNFTQLLHVSTFPSFVSVQWFPK
jgi:outer membrane protein W